jgi:glutathione S-transferase
VCAQGQNIQLHAGFSHDVPFGLPFGLGNRGNKLRGGFSRCRSAILACRRVRTRLLSGSLAAADYSGDLELIRIFHIEGRRSERVAWLLEEIGGIDYELDFIPGDILGSLLKLEDVHEARMAPIIQDGDLIMIESGAILEYLLSKYAKGSALRPPENSVEFPRYLQFLHYAEGTAMSKIALQGTLSKYLEGTGKTSTAPKLPGLAGSRSESERVLFLADNALSQSRYFAGDAFTAADIMMHLPLRMGGAMTGKSRSVMADFFNPDGEHFDAWPNVRRFLKDVADRPAYQRAVKITMPNGPPAM